MARKPPERGRDAVSLPPLPLEFKEALQDYLSVKPEPESSAPTKRRTQPKPETKRKRARKKAKR